MDPHGDAGRTRLTGTADERAVDRVEVVLRQIRDHGAPIRASDRGRDDPALERARARAERRAFEAGRGDLLDEAQEIVVEMYTLRLSDAGLWTGLVAASVPYSAEDRVGSQSAVLDLVTAAVAEDLLDPADVQLLRADGEELLGLPTIVTDFGSVDLGTPSSEHVDPPTVTGTAGVLRWLGGAALVVVVTLIVLAGTEDVFLAILVGAIVAGVLLLSVFGPDWWERRSQSDT